jgi:hypothetical protein
MLRLNSLNQHLTEAYHRGYSPSIFTQDGQQYIILPEYGQVNDGGCYEGDGIPSNSAGVRHISTTQIIAINLGEGFVPVVR